MPRPCKILILWQNILLFLFSLFLFFLGILIYVNKYLSQKFHRLCQYFNVFLLLFAYLKSFKVGCIQDFLVEIEHVTPFLQESCQSLFDEANLVLGEFRQNKIALKQYNQANSMKILSFFKNYYYYMLLRCLISLQLQLIELLEIPQLMETCIRGNAFSEALDLNDFVVSTVRRHQNFTRETKQDLNQEQDKAPNGSNQLNLIKSIDSSTLSGIVRSFCSK